MRLYLDSSYIAKCYLREPGTDLVLDLVESSSLRFSCILAAVEVQAVFHRHMREGKLSSEDCRRTMDIFQADQKAQLWRWIPLSETLIEHAARAFFRLSPTTYLRSADCLHLASARHAGFSEVYSNDRHLLNAASHFGLDGRDII